MRPLSAYRAAIFDLDGTLVDSMRAWDNICRDWLLAKGQTPAHSLEQEIKLMTLTEAAEHVICRFGVALTPAQIIAEWQQMVLGLYQNRLALKQGAAELLTALAARGLKLALATSCFPAACEAVLRRYDLWRLFSAVVYSDEVARGKTCPDIWLACAARLGVAPQDCVVFEDLRAAGLGIRAAGMDFVAVHDASCQEWELLSAEVDMAVLSLAGLLPLT